MGRNEVWRWYWRAWRRRLWMFHLLLVVLIAAEFYAASPKAPVLMGVILPTLLFAVPAIAFMVAYPQIRFKSETRTVILTAAGLDTTIKGKRRKIAWTDLGSVIQVDDYVILESRWMNALIIPPRAFATPEQRAAFAAMATGAAAPKSR